METEDWRKRERGALEQSVGAAVASSRRAFETVAAAEAVEATTTTTTTTTAAAAARSQVSLSSLKPRAQQSERAHTHTHEPANERKHHSHAWHSRDRISVAIGGTFAPKELVARHHDGRSRPLEQTRSR